ncbi:hypothetical protein CDAR_87971 [Caerostris darwini]|uniref:Uncharacterized protein n=1 Tax=Caerostris darwini TaxID=1538125 RepID=A0AAV4S4G8_9ARAC|nr:hypothetical protein CDAR_87971 [Caerostris darwini]
MKAIHAVLLISLLAGILSVSVADNKCPCVLLCIFKGRRGIVKGPGGNCSCDCDKMRQGRSEFSEEEQLRELLSYLDEEDLDE